MTSVWRRPSLTGLEVLWRWVFGSVALWLIATNAWRIWSAATQGTGQASTLGLDHLTVTDPFAASEKLSVAFAQLWPPAEHTCLWLLPMLFVGWVVASAYGRLAVLRRMDASLRGNVATLMILGALRVLFLAGTIGLWFWGLTLVGEVTVARPISHGEEPTLVVYFALAITETLVLFVAWAAASWVLSIAPLLAMVRGLDSWESLRAAIRLGPLRGKLVEINLVMGIVKIALVVLAMVFSATPLPFQAYTTDTFLWFWWAGITVLYLLASDFFHVVRTASALALCRAYGIDS